MARQGTRILVAVLALVAGEVLVGVRPLPAGASAGAPPLAATATPPSPPTGVFAWGGDHSGSANWSAPDSDGGLPITSYTVTASPGGSTCTWSAGYLYCGIAGLANGTSYTFTVTATNAAGTSPPSSPSSPVIPGGAVEGIGVTRGGNWYLRTSLTTGVSDGVFGFGEPGGTPVTGAWNACGWWSPNTGCHPVDGVGVVHNGVWDLAVPGEYSQITPLTISYGDPGDRPVVGAWAIAPVQSNGGGIGDGIGVVRNGTWYLRNTPSTGTADTVFNYGNPGDIPVVGDWNGDGVDTPGVVRNGIWYLRNSLTSGVADTVLAYGDPGDSVVAGKWTSFR